MVAGLFEQLIESSAMVLAVVLPRRGRDLVGVVLEQMHASDFARATIAAAKAESRSPLAAAGLPDNVQDQS